MIYSYGIWYNHDIAMVYDIYNYDITMIYSYGIWYNRDIAMAYDITMV